jgi:hypothetical protein
MEPITFDNEPDNQNSFENPKISVHIESILMKGGNHDQYKNTYSSS